MIKNVDGYLHVYGNEKKREHLLHYQKAGKSKNFF
jgi:hypothetical protein